MAKLILRQKAIDDLTDIWDFTAHSWSKNQADKYYGMIKTACRELANDDVFGKHYDNVESNLFGYRVGNHIVFYQRNPNDEIEAIRILHERMDLKNKLTE
jgi:toxin ParE1/3/4